MSLIWMNPLILLIENTNNLENSSLYASRILQNIEFSWIWDDDYCKILSYMKTTEIIDWKDNQKNILAYIFISNFFL